MEPRRPVDEPVGPRGPRDRMNRPGERAQPGDVVGIEEDGKVTELGDTREDEEERLRDAEEKARDEDR